MRQAFQFTSSFLAILCLLSPAIALGGCSATGAGARHRSLSPTQPCFFWRIHPSRGCDPCARLPSMRDTIPESPASGYDAEGSPWRTISLC
jgi:hypothetical protein